MEWFIGHLTLVSGIVGALAATGVAVGAFLQQQEQIRKSDEIATLNRQLARKSDEIARISTHIVGAVTGGESFVYLQPLRQEYGVRFFARQSGDYPTYDVIVRIQEIILINGARKRRAIFGPTEVGRMLKRGSGFDWTSPEPSGERRWPLTFLEPPPSGAKPREFRVELAARNGIVVQRLRVWPVSDRWHTDSLTIRHSGAAILALPADFQEAQVQGVTPRNRLEDDTEDS